MQPVEDELSANYILLATKYKAKMEQENNKYGIKYFQCFENMHKPFLYCKEADFLRNSEVFSSGNTFQNIPDYPSFSTL